jgi:hypothetical protein
MGEHVRVLGYLGILRAVVGAALGIYLLWKSAHIDLSAYGLSFVTEGILRFDSTAFLVLGCLSIAMACLRVTQGILTIRKTACARPFGVGLACFDFLNLAFFPVSTALGLYGLVVFRHLETVAYFEGQNATNPLTAGGRFQQ